MSYLRNSNVSPLRRSQIEQNQQQYQPTSSFLQNSQYGLPQQNSQSPYKNEQQQQDLRDSAYHNQRQQTGLWRSRAEDLEQDMNQQNNQLEYASTKARQADDYQNQASQQKQVNQYLQESNEDIKRQLSSKITECDIYRTKYEKEMDAKIKMKSQNDLQMKQLQEEISRLKDELNQNQVRAYKDVQDNKSYNEQLVHQKVNKINEDHCEDLGLYEEQIRKLRQIIEDREQQLAVMKSKMEQQQNEQNLDKVRFDEEVQKLQTQMSQMQIMNQNEKSLALSKSDSNMTLQVENLRNHYENEVSVLKGENQKIKDLLELKTREIASLINQNKDQKTNNQMEQEDLRDEIDALKNKIFEINQQKLDEIENIKESLEQQNEQDIQGLRFHHENQIDALEKEIGKLHEMIEAKTQQIDDQIREKLEQRQNYNSENDRLNDVINNMKEKQAQLEGDINQMRNQNDDQSNQKQIQHMQEMQQKDQQIDQLQSTIRELQQLLENRTQDLENTRLQALQKEEGLQNEVKVLQDTVEQLEKKLADLTHQTDDIIEGLKLDLNICKNEAQEQEKKNQITIESQQQEIERLKKINSVKVRECENLFENKQQLENQIQKQQKDIDNLQDNLNYSEKTKNQELQELRIKLEQQHEYAMNSTKQTFDNQVSIMEGEIQDLNIRLQLKDKEFQSYIEKYNKMEAIIQDFVNNPDKLKNKSDVISTKNLYDILKSSSNRSPVKRSYSPIKKSYNY